MLEDIFITRIPFEDFEVLNIFILSFRMSQNLFSHELTLAYPVKSQFFLCYRITSLLIIFLNCCVRTVKIFFSTRNNQKQLPGKEL